jgi:branched-subunit amino acid aminotransferase/4-amino-4-deoxychorismate lyase
MGGKLCLWKDAVLHVGCEALTRGLNVYEGVKGYWQHDGRFGIVMLPHHYERLRRSARLLHIPCDWTYEQYEHAIVELMTQLLEPDRDMWARTTLFAIEGHWGEGTVADLAETTGACVLMVRDGVISTPTASEGALESITLDAVEALAKSLGIPFVRRPIDRTELLIADEIAICGTLAELPVVRLFEGRPLSGKTSILSTLQKSYLNAVRGVVPHPAIEMTMVPGAVALTAKQDGASQTSFAAG